MSFFSAYLDASGHPDDEGDHSVLSVGGYAAAIESWIKFDGQWQAVLDSEGIKVFHMTDFVSGCGEFKGWSGKEPEKVERRKKFIASLVGCIESHCVQYFRESLYLRDYEKVNLEFMLEERIGKPYTVCVP